MNEKQQEKKQGYNRFLGALIEAPWSLANGLGRLLYGFQTTGLEKIPGDGPYIVWLTEPGLIGLIVSGYVSIKVLKPELDKGTDNVNFFHEELFQVPYFRHLGWSPHSFWAHRRLAGAAHGCAHCARPVLDRCLRNLAPLAAPAQPERTIQGHRGRSLPPVRQAAESRDRPGPGGGERAHPGTL